MSVGTIRCTSILASVSIQNWPVTSDASDRDYSSLFGMHFVHFLKMDTESAQGIPLTFVDLIFGPITVAATP